MVVFASSLQVAFFPETQALTRTMMQCVIRSAMMVSPFGAAAQYSFRSETAIA
jgi:hypothetical protein